MKFSPLLIILMWAGLLWSRALLSMSMIAILLIGVISYGREAWSMIRTSRWLQGMLILFLIPFISLLWSADKLQWWSAVQVKFPLLLMPFLIPLFRSFDKTTVSKLLALLCFFILLSSIYSYAEFFFNPSITSDYLKSKVLRVAMSGDHVRYAWLLVIVYAWTLYELQKGEWSRPFRITGYLFLAYLAIFIHVLSAKTGILGFYMVSLIAIFYLIPQKKKLWSLLLIVAIPLLAWFLLPSFQNRARFVLWDFQNYSRGSYTEGLSDGPRVLSYQAGLSIMKLNPVLGVGAGDVLAQTKTWYSEHADYLKDYERLLPSSELLMYGTAAGIFAALACLVIFLLPFFMKGYRQNMLWLSFHAICFVGFLYEIGLEVQYGVFLYAFFSCWFYSRLSPPAEADTV